MDAGIKNMLEEILNLHLNGSSLSQCFLPIKFGGLGIRLLSDIALPAFLSSFNSSYDLITEILSRTKIEIDCKYYNDALNLWHTLCPNDNIPINANKQEAWDLPFIRDTYNEISIKSVATKARMLALAEKESGGWLRVLPSPYLGTLLDRDVLRIASGIRIGAEICEPYTCICGYPVDKFGTHGLSCITKKGTFSRHIILNDLISNALSTAGFPSILEPPGLVRTDGKHPDGMTLVPWMRGKCLVWDATCVDTIASSYLKLTSKKAGAAANKAVAKKEKLYEEIFIKHNFLAFAVETFGTFSDDTKLFVKKLGPILNSKSRNVYAKSFFVNKISLAIQRGNVAGILGTIPSTAKIEEIYYLTG